ncbi:MAG: nucleoside permease [Chloroherpetonaceae bacterium]|nr:nucleoside permease [Chloroherpetonaceae bacterium]
MSANALSHGSAVGARLSVMMFLQFFVWGGWFVTVGNYMDSNGMKDAIAWAYSVGPIAAIVSPFFLGMIADRFFATERVLAVMHLLGGALLLLAPAVAAGGSPVAFVGLLLLHTLCYMPTLGLTNTLAFHNVTHPEKQFPLIRVFGTIGWIVANIVVSKMLHADTSALQFYVAGGAGILLGLYSFTLPHTPPPAAGQKSTVHDILGLDALALMRQTAFAVFLISSFLICIPLAFYYSWAPVFVKNMGFADPAFNMSFGQMSEIFFMLVMPAFFARLGVKYMLLVGMGAWVARYGLFAAAADSNITWMILAGIILHGICYDFFFVTGQIYVDRKASAKIRGQAQGLLVLVTQGLGMLIGAQVAGRVVSANTVNDVTAWKSVWLLPCIAAGVIMLVFFLLFREDRSAVEGTDRAVVHADSAEPAPIA